MGEYAVSGIESQSRETISLHKRIKNIITIILLPTLLSIILLYDSV